MPQGLRSCLEVEPSQAIRWTESLSPRLRGCVAKAARSRAEERRNRTCAAAWVTSADAPSPFLPETSVSSLSTPQLVVSPRSTVGGSEAAC